MGEDLFAFLLADMAEGVVVVDDTEKVVFCSEPAVRLLGAPAGEPFDAVAYLEARDGESRRPTSASAPGALAAIRAALAGATSAPWVVAVGAPNDRRSISVSVRPRTAGDGSRQAIVFLRDVTPTRDMAETQADAARLSALVDHLSTAVLFEDGSNRVALVNRAYCKMFGLVGPDAIVGASDHVLPVIDPSAFFRLRDARRSARTAAPADRVELLDGRVLERDYVPVDVAGVVQGHFWCYRDVTERERAREHLAELSNRDELTTLYNRRGFVTLAEQWLRLAARTKRTPLLLFVDVNGMKPVNDRLGHAMGDRMLRDTADLLRATFRDSDIVARLGGDEFVVLAVDALPNHAALLQERLQRNIERFNQTVQRPFVVSMSVGVSVWDPAQPRSVAELLAEADARMYEAKRRRTPHPPVRTASGA
jgi:diguanylate cyclase (GGDEF)-like protein